MALNRLSGTAVSIAISALAIHPPQEQQAPTFHANTSIVSIDVRAVDKDGRAITDLTKADFTVTEDGARQTIAQFEQDTATNPTHPRWIVIVLGEGRIQAPFKSLDALEDFITTGLTPTDHVGVIAYNRWSEFTTHRDAIVALLRRYKSRNDEIQTDLETYNSGVRKQTGNAFGANVVQDKIDEIFRDFPGSSVREFAPPSEISTGRPRAWESTRFTQVRFSDLLHVYGAIDYLAPVDGEKHVIFLTEQGHGYGPARPSRLATIAADNRVALHIVQTGGFGERSTITPHVPPPRLRGIVYPPTSTAEQFNFSRAAHDVTEDTGGLSFFYTDLGKAFRHIADAIRVDYLIGYAPSNQNWHGEYRHVDVHVNRPGVAAIYRRGYQALTTPPPWNDRETMTDVRMSEVRTALHSLRGITLQLKTKTVKTSRNDSAIDVELQIEPSAVDFAVVHGRHVASLDVAIWVTDKQGNEIGVFTDRIDLQLTEASYANLTKQSIVFARRIPAAGKPFEVRAGVYDYDNDRVGGIVKRIQ